ncbi:TonB-dependent receptor [Mucilaginibacter myungsuensis]|uniref:TonB-dependent receptor n=1 Tax=Mucilaginibacter myungsuensis TaxID=649104 RepID=A0A929PXL6_9SPHI|nr:TonB-dependent receptor [Mucilaginibacter myungsuensis]MBE9663306.1 TonB-dependent receptor [Mucilaginibacter myungsuensis]MDN3600041.1 TonB-dependent receptor [Mucilaginibacter myungsuensis]
MRSIKSIWGLAGLVCAVALLAFIRADDDPIKKIVTQLSKWADEQPQEKVYLHLDKPFYATGEDIWFKAYVTVGDKHQLSALSKILYVDLINDRDSIKQSLKLMVSNGIAWGDFSLADTLRAGNYRVRAYTNYMRNAGGDYFFDKTLVIGNVAGNAVYTKTNFTYVNANGKPQVNATITYADLNGKPYANKEVSYEVQGTNANIAKGKGTTDAAGALRVSFSGQAEQRSARIVTTIKYADKKSDVQVVPVKALSNTVDVQFFPEGGTMVAGSRTKVAFKATGADGLGVDVTGTIKDNNNADVAALGRSHYGMGFAMLTPETGKTYKAVVKLPDGSEQTINLPAAAATGYNMGVFETDKENILLRIGASKQLADAGNTSISVVAQQNGHIYYAANTLINKASLTASIPKNRFPTGIVQFTMFSSAGEPLAERLLFVRNDDLMKLSIGTDKQTYAPRQKVNLTVGANTPGGQPSVGTFSVVVIDESKVQVDEDDETTILNNILLTSDLKGYIEKPNYYFNKPTEQTNADLDALMLTQGYRRFAWKQILSDVFPPIAFKAEQEITISGTVKSGKQPAPGAKVTLFTTASGPFILDTVADADGRFVFKDMIFKDSIRFVIQARTAKGGKNVEIEMDDIAAPATGANRNAPDLVVGQSDVLSTYLLNSKNQYLQDIKYGLGNHVTVLKEVVIAEKKKTMQNSANLNGGGNANQILKADDLSTCPTLDMCLNGRLNFVMFRGGIPYSTRTPNVPMTIVLDGMPMGSNFGLDNIVTQDVETIEVLRTPQYTNIYGTQGNGGLLVITSKRGGSSANSANYRYAPGLITYAPKGYNTVREFYAPKYDAPNNGPAMADYRSTIFWAPNLVTGKDGKATTSYFNADGKGSYRVVVEGIDADGNLGRQVLRYKVE